MSDNFLTNLLKESLPPQESGNERVEDTTHVVDNNVNNDVDNDVKTEKEQSRFVDAENDVSTEQTDTETQSDFKDYNKLVEERFGYQTIEDLLNSDIHEKLKVYDNLLKQSQDREIEVHELYKQFETVNNPFANDKIAKLNEFMKQHPEMDYSIASRIINSDIDSFNNLEKLVLDYQIRFPELPKRNIERKIAKDLGVTYIDDLADDDLDDDIKLDLDTQVREASKRLKQYANVEFKAGETLVPEKVREYIKQRQEDAEQRNDIIEREWLPIAQRVEQNFKEIEIPILTKDNTLSSYAKMVLTPEESKQYGQLVVDLAKMNGLTENNQQSQQFILQSIQNAVIVQRLPEIIKYVVDKATNLEFQRYKRERDGVSNERSDVSDKGNNQQKNIMDILGEKVREKSWRDTNL